MFGLVILHPGYLAGIFDSDGSFSICRRLRNGIPYFQVQLGLTWVDAPRQRSVAEAAKGRYGGGVYGPYRLKGRRRPVLRYQIGGWGAVTLIRDILPYLEVKDEQARCCLRAIELRRLRAGQRYRHFPPEARIELARLSERVQSLNAGRAR